jgi:hypothetical protein
MGATTLGPNKPLLHSRAKKPEKSLTIEETLCPKALEALQRGDLRIHVAF